MLNITSEKNLNVSEETSTTKPEPYDGYDIPVFGLDNGKFAYLHITALSCISISFTFTMFVFIVSFKSSRNKFFSKTKSERFVVYMAICDGLFNMAHSCDHLHIFITKDHVRPRGLCVFYAFIIGGFIWRDLSFGKYDWRLLVYTFGIPFIVYLVAAFLGKLGPTGAL